MSGGVLGGERTRGEFSTPRASVRQAIDSYTTLGRIPLGLRPDCDLDGASWARKAAGGLGRADKGGVLNLRNKCAARWKRLPRGDSIGDGARSHRPDGAMSP